MTTEISNSPNADSGADKAAADKAAADKAAADKAAADSAGADKAAADKAAADKLAADKSGADKAAADKAAADKLVADKAAADKAGVKPNAPEKYEAFVAPEGVNLDAEVTSAFEAVAKELDLPQDKAQTIITKLSPVLKARGEAATAQVRSDMLAALKGDKDIGGEKFQSTVDAAKAAIEVHFTPGFKKFLDDTGLGNHPEMARGLSKIGAKLIADGWVPANKETAKDGDARSFFPNSQMNA